MEKVSLRKQLLGEHLGFERFGKVKGKTLLFLDFTCAQEKNTLWISVNKLGVSENTYHFPSGMETACFKKVSCTMLGACSPFHFPCTVSDCYHKLGAAEKENPSPGRHFLLKVETLHFSSALTSLTQK